MSITWSWIILVVAGLIEVAWAISLKYAEGFTKLIPSLINIGTMASSVYLLSKAGEQIPIGTAYAVWVGIGALGAAILGIYLFDESASFSRIFFLILLLISIIGLKLTA